MARCQLHSSGSMAQDSSTCAPTEGLGHKRFTQTLNPQSSVGTGLSSPKVQSDETRRVCIIKAGKISLSLALAHGYFEASQVFYKL